MSKIEISLKDNVLTIHKVSSREKKNDTENYQIDLLEIGKRYKSNFKVTKRKDKNRILFLEKIDSTIEEEDIEDEDLEENKIKKQPVIVVFSEEENIRVMYCTMEEAYKNLLKLKYKVFLISLNKRRVRIGLLAYFVNKYEIECGEQKFYIDKKLSKKCKLKQYKDNISKLKSLKDFNISKKNSNIINNMIDINSIIPKNKLSKLNDNSIIFNSFLEKIIKIPERNKIIYNERFCILTKKNFSYYKSKESYLNLSRPMLLINLKNIIKVEQTILDDTSFYFGLICIINDETRQYIDKINTFINIGDNNSEEFLLGFRSKNKDLIIKWIIVLNYFIENYE